MATFSMTDVTTWVHGHDFTTDLNQMSLKTEVADLDKTTFGGGGYKARAGGLRDATLTLNGYWDSSPDSEGFTDLGSTDRAVTVTPTGTEGDIAYLAQLGKFSYEAFGGVGDMTPFTLECRATNNVGVVRGKLAAAVQDVSATGVIGSGVLLSAASSSQYIYAVVHVFSAGTTVTIDVQSDDNSGFTSATTVATIGPLTATGGTWMVRVAGPATDTYYRFNCTAVTGTFSIAGAIAVQ